MPPPDAGTRAGRSRGCRPQARRRMPGRPLARPGGLGLAANAARGARPPPPPAAGQGASRERETTTRKHRGREKRERNGECAAVSLAPIDPCRLAAHVPPLLAPSTLLGRPPTQQQTSWAYRGKRLCSDAAASWEQTAVSVLRIRAPLASPVGLLSCDSRASTSVSMCLSTAAWPNIRSMRRMESREAWKTAWFDEAIARLTMGTIAFTTSSACGVS
mmetsp:Transcript_39497/g.123207  ORF Transcript_39497/g.123207 Transcript_39497/m.123207 type:complete len:217 (+) Transcript_39497:3-653(+)